MQKPEKQLKFLIPKGSLQETVETLLKTAGYKYYLDPRGYRPSINDPEIDMKMLRPQEIPNYLIGENESDLGITGIDWVRETRTMKDVELLLDLNAGKVKLVFGIPQTWTSCNSFDDFLEEFAKNKRQLRISTEYINTTLDFIARSNKYKQYYGDKKPKVITPWYVYGDNEMVKIYLSFGATEAKPPEEVDAIVDNTETGSTLRANGIKIVDVIDTSSAYLIGNKAALKNKWKAEKIKDIMTLLQGVVDARQKLHVFFNIRDENLPKMLDSLPALKNPTIAKLAVKGSEGWSAINTVIPRDDFLKMIPIFRKWAQGLVVFEPRQILPLEKYKSDNE
ncbi:MAG: ATP phosphoribosyltransferase [Candidatus Sigynarchaeota archaeon]